jgi:putative nucleotidyltransferase-like protein
VNSIIPAGKSGAAPSREADLLLNCATSTVTPERTARVRAIIASGVDWGRATHLASTQAVMPLVYRYLSAQCVDALPPDAIGGMQRAFYGNSVRNLYLARELARVTRLLGRNGIETLALKGPALAVAAYGAVAMRQFTDLDLLVRENAAARAVDLLLDEGYALSAGYELADLERPDTYEIALARAGTLSEIDLHSRLIPPYFPLAIDGEELWRRAVPLQIEGATVRTLAPADHLLFLCAHGAKHGWQALGGICDLAELMRVSARDSTIDWDVLDARAERAGARRALRLGVLLAHELLEAPAPAALLEASRREPALVRAAHTFARYVSNPGDAGPGFYQRWSVPLCVIADFGARLRYVAARTLLPSADDRRFMRLPAMLYPLYYLLRPVRVALREGPAFWRRLMRSAPPAADHRSR